MTAGRTLGREEEARAVLAEYATRALERIPILDARHIFLGRLADFPSAIGGNPLFQRLPAVRAGRVDEVEGRTWNQGSVIAANAILDDIEEALA